MDRTRTLSCRYTDADGATVEGTVGATRIEPQHGDVVAACRVEAWGWTFGVNASGEIVHGAELAARFSDDGAELAEWLLEGAEPGRDGDGEE